MPPIEATSLSKGLQTWSWPKMEGPTSTFRARCVCLMRDTVQFFAFTQNWAWRPKTIHLINGLVLSSLHCWNPGSRLPDQDGFPVGRSQRTQSTAIPQGGQHLLLSNKVRAQLEAVVSIDPSPPWGPEQKGQPKDTQLLLFHTVESCQRTDLTFFLAPVPSSKVPRWPASPSPPSPSFPTIEMVCKMLLGDTEVFKWLLVSGFKGPFPGSDMEQLAGGL